MEITLILVAIQAEVLIIYHTKWFQKCWISEEKKGAVKYVFEKVKICCWNESSNGQ